MLQVRSLALLSRLGIWPCHELWCGSQTRLRSCVAVALAQTGGYSSDLTPSLGTSICHGCGPRKDKKTKKNFFEAYFGVLWWLSGLRVWHCQYCGSGYSCGAGLTPGLGTSANAAPHQIATFIILEQGGGQSINTELVVQDTGLGTL